MTVIFGTDANDTLAGTDENDSIFGLGGDDRLFGNRGNDTILGGDGSDRIDGGDGDDRIFGENGTDRLTGGLGDDAIFGGDGDDDLAGVLGNDFLDGGSGNDILNGAGVTEVGYLTSRGKGEIDILTGREGEDTFVLVSRSPRTSGAGPSYLGNGNSDYALITDFNPHEDVIRLAVSEVSTPVPTIVEPVEYSLGAAPEGLPQGTAIYANNLGTKPDLIAVLQGIEPDSVSLSGDYFNFVNP